MTKTLIRPALRADLEPAVSAFKAAPTQAADWVIDEFAQAAMPDQRHRRRLQIMATAFAQKPTAPIPQACPNGAEAKAAYRFLENDRILPGAIRQAHHQATLQRGGSHRLVLAVQDTTSLNYSPIQKPMGWVRLVPAPRRLVCCCIRPWRSRRRASRWDFCTTRCASAQRPSARPPPPKKAGGQRESQVGGKSDACQALTAQCPQTQLVNIADREGDLYELFVQALSVPETPRVQVLVRARHDRKLADPDRTLWQEVDRQPVATTLSVLVGRRGDRPSRMANSMCAFAARHSRRPTAKPISPRSNSGPSKPGKVRRCPGRYAHSVAIADDVAGDQCRGSRSKGWMVCATLANRGPSQSAQEWLPNRAATTGNGPTTGAGVVRGFGGGLAHLGVVQGGAGTAGQSD